ncbi:MAG: alpha/beta hydrolase [Halorhabdus sp.]
MHTEVSGTGADLVFVLGWGNKPEHETVRWLIDRLVEADYRVHAIEIPTTITDFDAEYLQPVAEYVAALSSYRLLTHSTGGLIGAFLSEPKTRVYLSPWWGIHEDQDGLLAKLFARLPIARPLFPTGIDAEAIGTLASGDQLADGPDAVAPTFLREIRRAQAALPPFRSDSVVFFSPGDRVVSPTAIRERVPAENRVPYDGGHELFSSTVREEYLPLVLDTIESGGGALSEP